MSDRANALIGLAAAIGGFAIGKAAIDHVIESRGPVDTDLSEFEEQHYRAAGFIEPDTTTDDIVAFGAAIAGIVAAVAAFPTVWEEAKKLLGAK